MFWGGVFYKCSLDPYGYWIFVLFCFLSSLSLLILYLVVPLIFERSVLKPSTIIIDLSISPFSSISFASYILQLCFVINTDLELLCIFGGLSLLSLRNVLTLSLVIFFALKSILSDINIIFPDFFY